MRSLVTGGAGFIGSHLVDRLLTEGHEVIVVDNLSTGHRGNIEHLHTQEKFEFHEADVRDFDAISEYFEGVDWVFHLAALADIVPSIQQPLGYLRAGVDGTISVLEAARQAEVKKFLYAASSSCYGIPDVYPTPETAEIRPQYPYALAKNLGEQCVMHWGTIYNLPVISLRLFNVYGPRARTTGTYGAVFGVFLAQKLAEKPFTVVGDGNQTRDFTYVSDVVDSFWSAADSPIINEIMNVGSSQTYSINQLVEQLGGEVVHIPKRPGEPDCTFADVTKIEQLLNWSAKVSFEKGVTSMLEHIDYWRDAPVWDPDSIEDSTKDWFKYLSEN
jgi:UDP-glucose 4-epimerase